VGFFPSANLPKLTEICSNGQKRTILSIFVQKRLKKCMNVLKSAQTFKKLHKLTLSCTNVLKVESAFLRDGILHLGFTTEWLSWDTNCKTQEFFDILENLKEAASRGLLWG
jgi:hypothetical protein